MSATPQLPSTYRAWVLNEYARGPMNDNTFKLVEQKMPDVNNLPESHVLIKVQYIGLEPAMRPSISLVKSYREPQPLGQPMWAYGIGKVVASTDPKVQVGSQVVGKVDMQEYALLDSRPPRSVSPYDPRVGLDHLSALGPPGLAAWFGLVDVAKVKAGDVVVVSAAAGATGSIVVQLAKAYGASRIIGIASKAKCQSVVDIGADACLDYNSETFVDDLKKATEEKATIYFDNVGGHVTDAVLGVMAPHGRLAICGSIGDYQSIGGDESGRHGLKNFRSILLMRLQVQGFVVPDFPPESFVKAYTGLTQLIKQGKLKTEIFAFPNEGIENSIKALEGLFTGMNKGKMTIKYSD